MPAIVEWMRIDVEKDIRFGNPKRSMTGGISIPMTVYNKETETFVPFIHQTPQLNLPFGISKLEMGKDVCYKADFGFVGVRKEENTDNFYGEDDTVLAYFRFIERLEKFIKTTAQNQCKEWFKKEYDIAKIDEIYCSNIKGLQNAIKYAPTFPTKLKVSDGRADQKPSFHTSFFDEDETPLEIVELEEIVDLVPRGSKVISILETSGLWFNRTGFGLSFKVAQMMVFKKDEFTGCAIRVPLNLQRPASLTNFNIPGFEDTKRLREDEDSPEDCKIRKVETQV